MELQNTATELFLGIDIGSTTAKIVLRNGDKILLERYERHFSQVREKTAELLRLVKEIAGDKAVKAAISGSAGLGLAEAAHIPFVQEVFATAQVVKLREPDTLVRYRAGRRGREDNLFQGRNRRAYERQLRGRHGCVY